MKKMVVLIVSFFISGVMFLPVALAGDEDTVLAIVGNKKITQKDLNEKLEEIPPYARGNFNTPEGKKKLLMRLVKTELLKQAAVEAGYDQRPEIKKKIEDARERILTTEYFKNEVSVSGKPSDKDLRAYYESHKEKFKKSPKAQVRQILVDDEHLARKIYNDIASEKLRFSEAVSRYSKDEITKKRDGRMKPITKGDIIPGVGQSEAFERMVFSAEVGKVCPPIKTKRGWHIIIVDSRDDQEYKSFDEVKNQIADDMLVTDEDIQAEYKNHPEKYRNRARVKISHILVKSELEARAIYKQLKNGADFNTLVKEKSLDSQSVKKNGSLGYVYKDGYIGGGIGKDPNFEAAVFALNVGDISEPLKSRKGWHIVRVDEKIGETLKPLSEVRTQIRNKLIRDAKQKKIDDTFDALMQKFQCKIYEDRLEN